MGGLDVAGARDRLGGNAALLTELLRTFAAEHACLDGKIGMLLRELRPATAAAELHRMKSAARIIGAKNLAAAAQALEDDIRHGRPVDLTAFASMLSEVVDAIGSHVGAGPDNAPSAGVDADRS